MDDYLNSLIDWANWTKWKRKFLWCPRKIKGKWYWLRFIYERKRLMLWYSQKYEYDYALDIFDILRKS